MNKMISINRIFKKQFAIHATIIALLIFIFRMAIPYLSVVFFSVVVIYIAYIAIYFFKNKIKPDKLLFFLKKIWIFLLLIIGFCFAMFLTKHLSVAIYKELANGILSLFFICGLFLLSEDNDDFSRIINDFISGWICLSFFIAICGLVKLFLTLFGVYFKVFYNNGFYLLGTSLMVDYNFFALTCLIGLLFILYRLSVKQSNILKYLYQAALFLLTLTISLSGSRRGEFSILIIFSSLIIFRVVVFFIKTPWLLNLIKQLKLFLLLLFVILLIAYIFIFGISDSLKAQFFTRNGLRNMEFANYIEEVIYRTKKVISTKSSIDDARLLFWEQEKSIPQMTGFIINSWVRNGFDKLFLNESVESNNTSIKNCRIWGYPEVYRNADSLIFVKSNQMNYGIYREEFVFSNQNKSFWVNIKVFKWSPMLRLMILERNTYYEKYVPDSWASDSAWHTLVLNHTFKQSMNTGIWIVGGTEIQPSCFAINGIFSSADSSSTKLVIEKSTPPVAMKFIFPYDKIAPASIERSQQKYKQKIDNVLLVTDSSLVNIDSIQRALENDFFASRYERWCLALSIFNKSYSLPEKIVGGGFDYQRTYGDVFFHDPNRLDYPHNPVFSALLYGGIINVVLVCYFLILTFYYFIKKAKALLIFFIVWLFILLFVFFSGNSIISIPVFSIFCLMPFLYISNKYYSG